MSAFLPPDSSVPHGQAPVTVVFDACGRQVFPAPPPVPGFGHHCAVCNCSPAGPGARAAARWSPGAAVAAGAAGALVVGTVLVALLLSVALVAVAVAVAALSLTVVALVVRSMLSSPHPGRQQRHR
ncbi:hypothetical protein ACFP1Z_06700 [Streptomyces gamaensis]|uniref:SpdD-like protein n=1 Tax=Streptomyces gamaensis TaxID=1763542 RepID=A0ABW0YVS5_9ACTN